MTTSSAIELSLEPVLEAMLGKVKPLQRLESAQRAVDAAKFRVDEAVRRHNATRLQMIIDAIIAQNQGWCSFGRHLAPEADLFGILTSYSYVTNGYYNYVKTGSNYGTACREHLTGATGSSRSSEDEWSTRQVAPLQVRSVWTNMIHGLLNSHLRNFVAALSLPPEILQAPGLPYGRYTINGKPLVVDN